MKQRKSSGVRAGSSEGWSQQTATLTDDEDEDAGRRQEAEVLGGASEPLSEIGFAGGVVIEVLPDAVVPDLLVISGQLHLHLAVFSFHVLGQVEACVRVRLPIKLRKKQTRELVNR